MAIESSPSSESYVFHRVPDDLRGSMLYPLNQLAGVHPDLYTELRKRYATREDIAALRIPPLGNCLWNDVLHFSPVHPNRLKQALEGSGHALPDGWHRFFQVDTRLLAPADTVIYRSETIFWSGKFDIGDASKQLGRECLPFDPGTLRHFGEIPQAARDYFASVAPGSGLALFLGVPHVLFKGRIDLNLAGVEVIEV